LNNNNNINKNVTPDHLTESKTRPVFNCNYSVQVAIGNLTYRKQHAKPADQQLIKMSPARLSIRSIIAACPSCVNSFQQFHKL